MLDDDRLMRGVSSIADCAHPIKRRHAQRSREVAVRAAASRSLLEHKAKLSRKSTRRA